MRTAANFAQYVTISNFLQVVELTNFGDGRGRTLLVLAVGGGRPEILQLVAQFVRGKLNNNQVAKSGPQLYFRSSMGPDETIHCAVLYTGGILDANES